jgi:hypothetical protein
VNAEPTQVQAARAHGFRVSQTMAARFFSLVAQFLADSTPKQEQKDRESRECGGKPHANEANTAFAGSQRRRASSGQPIALSHFD